MLSISYQISAATRLVSEVRFATSWSAVRVRLARFSAASSASVEISSGGSPLYPYATR